MIRRVVLIFALVSFALSACDKQEQSPDETETTPPTTPPTTPQPAPEEAPKEERNKQEPVAEEGAQWVSSDAYGVRFRVADDWEVAQQNDAISVTSPDGTITVLLVGTESEGLLSAALEAVKQEVEFKDVKLEKDSQTTVNGLPGYTAEGSAVMVKEAGDQEIQFLMNSVRAGEHGVALMVFAEAEMYEARKEELQGLLKTLQRQ